MSSPARAGARRLIMLDSRTFMIAIAPQATMVPGNSMEPGSAPRSSRPADTRMSAPNSARSSPSRRLSHAASPETAPKHSTGVAASSVTVAEDRCSRVSSSGKTGGRLVMAARRLNASAAIDTTSSAPVSDRRRSPPRSRPSAHRSGRCDRSGRCAPEAAEGAGAAEGDPAGWRGGSPETAGGG